MRLECRAQHICLLIFSTILMLSGSSNRALGSMMSCTRVCSSSMLHMLSTAFLILSRKSVLTCSVDLHLSRKWAMFSSSFEHSGHSALHLVNFALSFIRRYVPVKSFCFIVALLLSNRLYSTVVHKWWWLLFRNGLSPMYFNDKSWFLRQNDCLHTMTFLLYMICSCNLHKKENGPRLYKQP